MKADLQQSGEPIPIATYREFWPFYLGEHSRPQTRRLHYLGTGGAFAALVLAVLLAEPWILIAVPPLGYGPAWMAHFWVERNRPATFRHPVWSLISDVRMFVLWLSGRIDAELARHSGGATRRSDS